MRMRRVLWLATIVIAVVLTNAIATAEACCWEPTQGSSTISVYAGELLPPNPVLYLFESDFSDAPDISAQSSEGDELALTLERMPAGDHPKAKAYVVSIATGEFKQIAISQRGITTLHNVIGDWRRPTRWATLSHVTREPRTSGLMHVTAEGQALLVELADSPEQIEQGDSYAIVSPLPRSWSKRPPYPFVVGLRKLRNRWFPRLGRFPIQPTQGIAYSIVAPRELTLGRNYCGASVVPPEFLKYSFVRVTPLFADGSRGHASKILPLNSILNVLEPWPASTSKAAERAPSSPLVRNAQSDWLVYLLAYGAGFLLGLIALLAWRRVLRSAAS